MEFIAATPATSRWEGSPISPTTARLERQSKVVTPKQQTALTKPPVLSQN